MKKIPTSLFGRGSKLLSIAGKIAFEEVTGRLKNWEDDKEKLRQKVQLAQEVVRTLSQLKGASMKVGQLLSLDLGDYLPPDIVKVLEQLHQKSTFLDYPEIEKILKRELGDKFSELEDISREPIAAASIGQVHKAKLKNKTIVLKVQYPGVAESIPSDLKILEVLLKQASFLFGKSETDIGPFLEEVRVVLVKEADYRNELQMHQRYRESFKDHDFIIPEVYPEFSTGLVLTQEFIAGVSFTDWLTANPGKELRSEIGSKLMKLYLEELFTFGLVQTDPNPGNFLMTADHKIALLDFGAVKTYDKEFVRGYRSVLLAAFEGNRETLLKESYRMGFIDEREETDAKAIYLEMMDFLCEPFRSTAEFDFTDNSFFIKSRDLSLEMTRRCRYSPPPKELLFLHRKLAGIFIFLKRLDVKIRLRDYWHYVETPR